MGYPELYVMRHGETEWNAQRRLQGALNSPLTETGVQQALRQGALLADVNFERFDIFTSPQGRAFQTAALALGARARLIRTDDRLREIGVGDWSGKRRGDLVPATGATLEDTPDGPLALYEHAPGGEGFAALRARCEAFLTACAGPAILVTHGITSRMLRAVVMGLPSAALGDLPGGQGVVYHLSNSIQTRLE